MEYWNVHAYRSHVNKCLLIVSTRRKNFSEHWSHNNCMPLSTSHESDYPLIIMLYKSVILFL